MPLPSPSARVTSSRRLLLTAAALVAVVGGCGPTALTFAGDARRTGLDLYQKGDYVNAAAAFANATRQDPRDYQSYYYLGASHQAVGNYQQATADYRSCLAEQQLTLAGQQDAAIHYQARDNLAQCIAKGGTAPAEEAAMEAHLRQSPGDVDGQWLLAKVYANNGQADEAIEAYTRTILIDPKRFDIAKEAGLYEVSLGQKDRAVAALKQAYADNPDDAQVNGALHDLGVVVGPSLKPASDLSKI